MAEMISRRFRQARRLLFESNLLASLNLREKWIACQTPATRSDTPVDTLPEVRAMPIMLRFILAACFFAVPLLTHSKSSC